MLQSRDVASQPCFSLRGLSLSDQIAEAVSSRQTPLSQLLRLMAALDAQGGDDRLRRLLRTRIGEPLQA